VGLGFFAAIVPAILVHLTEQRFARWATPLRFAIPLLLGIGLIAAQVTSLLPTMRGFQHDARTELIAFLNTRYAPNVQLVMERRSGLDQDIDGKEKLQPFQLQTRECAADIGTLAEMRQQGVNYIVTHGPTRNMFTSSSFKPKAGVSEDYERRRTFYEQLDRECRLIWRTRKSKVLYLSPDLRLYDLAQAPLPSTRKP
jgi:hypothetical protein